MAPSRHPDLRGLRRLALALSAIAFVLTGSALASDPPDATVNAASGQIETVDCVSQGGQLRIRHSAKLNQAWVRTTLTLTAAQDDTSPRIAASDAGASYVVFVRNTTPSRVLLISRPDSRSDWSAERVISNTGENSHNARVVHDGSRAHIAYEIDDGCGTRIAAVEGDDPSGYPTRTIVGSTTNPCDHDLSLVTETGHTWLSWIDVGSTVAWAMFDPTLKTWSAANFEPYAADSVAAARDRIRTKVLSTQ